VAICHDKRNQNYINFNFFPSGDEGPSRNPVATWKFVTEKEPKPQDMNGITPAGELSKGEVSYSRLFFTSFIHISLSGFDKRTIFFVCNHVTFHPNDGQSNNLGTIFLLSDWL
jgi:hypothetical protein